ncbi:reverse transcriptase family protein, partial [Klebsiella pneumoniae]|uniref:reverse transcriptase family protein n=1 Tax=Klebsiella pneumoniae TaxID=573 RepID=UPI00200E0233
KQRKFKTEVSDKIKEEITKQLKTGVIRVVQYTTWLANVVPVPKKDGKTRVCVDYRDLNKASPKDNFPLPNIHILVDNCAKHEIQSFVDCYAGYHQVLMDEEDAEKTAFT